MRLRHIVLAPALVLVVSACSGGSTPSPSVAASVPPVGSGSPGVQTIAVKLTDALKMEPAQMTVKAGQPVIFMVTNAGSIQHEFYLGDEPAQSNHEREMMSSGGMTMDEADGIVLKPGETKALTHTFASAGFSLAGCHETGHYAGGMKAAITVID